MGVLIAWVVRLFVHPRLALVQALIFAVAVLVVTGVVSVMQSEIGASLTNVASGISEPVWLGMAVLVLVLLAWAYVKTR